LRGRSADVVSRVGPLDVDPKDPLEEDRSGRVGGRGGVDLPLAGATAAGRPAIECPSESWFGLAADPFGRENLVLAARDVASLAL
jgi:hypothetical protein